MSSRTYYDHYSWARPTSRSSATYYPKTPTSVTAKYLLTIPSQKSSSIPIRRDGSTNREISPVDFNTSRPKTEDTKTYGKYDKSSYSNKLHVPTASSSRSISPVSTSSNNPVTQSRYASPDIKSKSYKSPESTDAKKNDSKSLTPTSVNYNLNNYKIYPRSSSAYSRSALRTELKPDISVNRYFNTRPSSNILKSTENLKKSVSPDPNRNQNKIVHKNEIEQNELNNNEEISHYPTPNTRTYEVNDLPITVITRHTSPTPPGSSHYLRTRRADSAKIIEDTIVRPHSKVEISDKEVQTDRIDESIRSSIPGNNIRTNISLGRSSYSPGASTYAGFAGRYSTQYAGLGSNNNREYYFDRSSRSRSKEPISMDNTNLHTLNDQTKKDDTQSHVKVYENNEKDNVSPEITINVNLKLKPTPNPIVPKSTENVLPKTSISSSEMQSPLKKALPETNQKARKKKVRKCSTDSLSSTSSGSKSKSINRRSKTASLTDSEQDAAISKVAARINENAYSKHRTCSTSPESNNTKSSQSTTSEDDVTSKSALLSDLSQITDISSSQSVGQNIPKIIEPDGDNIIVNEARPKSKILEFTENRFLDSSASESTGKDVSNITTESEITSKSKCNSSSNLAFRKGSNNIELKIVKTINSVRRDKASESNYSENYLEKNPEPSEQDKIMESKSVNQNCSEFKNESSLSSEKRFKTFNDDSKPWWLDSNGQIPDGVERLSTSHSSALPSDKKFDFYNVRHIDSGEKKDWWLTSSEKSSSELENNNEAPMRSHNSSSSQTNPPGYKIRHINSGEKPWWLLNSSPQVESSTQTGSKMSCDAEITRYSSPSNNLIPDEEPLEDRRSPDGLEAPEDSFPDQGCEENPWCRIDSTEVKIHSNKPQYPVIKKYSRENAVVLQAQTPVSMRVPALIDRLMQCQGRELRRALFSLKQMLQSDDELVEGFVAYKGLDCLIELANRTDCHYLDYILRAFEQVLLYEDGMHGVIAHSDCIQWLYTLIGSELRHIVKTAFKFLLVFVDYNENNCLLVIDAITKVESRNGRPPWYKVMQLLQDVNSSDAELLVYAINLINKCLNNISERKLYLDHVDTLLDQGIDNIIQIHMSKKETDLDLLRQLQIFETTLTQEDGNEIGTHIRQLADCEPKTLRQSNSNANDAEISPKRHQISDKGFNKYTNGLQQRMYNGTLGHSVTSQDALQVRRHKPVENNIECKEPIAFSKEHTIKEITEKLTAPSSPIAEEKHTNLSEMAGIVLKAKEELAKSQSKERHKSPIFDSTPKVHEKKISENDIHWEELKKKCMNREFNLCDLDFSDLREDSDEDMTSSVNNCAGAPPPPPPPSIFLMTGAPPPPPGPLISFPQCVLPPQPPRAESSHDTSSSSKSTPIKKNKKTVKLFWREIIGNPVPKSLKTKVGGFFWDDLPDINLDTKKLEHLFESRSNDLIIKDKMADPKRNLILDAKRSNAINIAMKKLPTPQIIKVAIMKMDATMVGKEGIEKLLTMLPTEEERIKIQEAQLTNPDLPLGSAEQFLLTLDSIPELSSRLKLWVFKLDFENIEKEIAESLMDLKLGIELLKENRTFKLILATLRSVGSFLNGNMVKGFRLDYLSKVMEVKDTVHKHPLLYHLCEMILEKFPETSDLFSEVGPVIRASKVDFDMLHASLTKLETDCKSSWDHLKKVTKHEVAPIFRTKINDFLRDAAERIILLTVIKKRVMNRYSNFLLYLGIPMNDVDKTKPSEFLKVIAEFALEYRTTRERVLLHLTKKANHQAKSKPNAAAAAAAAISSDASTSSAKAGDGVADSALKEILKCVPYSDNVPDRRKHSQSLDSKRINGDASEENEIFESLVRSTTQKRHPNGRNRSSSRATDRSKSFK